MTRTRTSVLGATFFLLAGALALTLVLLTGRSSGGNQVKLRLGAGVAGAASKETSAGEGPVGGYEAYVSASRTYPANVISPAIVKRAQATFSRLAKRDARFAKTARGRHFLDNNGGKWEQYGPRRFGLEPGVISFSGATNVTASRSRRIVADPDCTASKCRVWAGTSGGGVWRTDNVLASDPTWQQMSPDDLDQNSVGTLTLDPTDKKHDTLYLGTGEGNRCSSGCEAGVGIYKSTNGGEQLEEARRRVRQQRDVPVRRPRARTRSSAAGSTRSWSTRANANHIFVGSAPGVRGLSHMIGNGGTTRLEPGANDPGLYESTDGGATFTEVWNGNSPDSASASPTSGSTRSTRTSSTRPAFDAGAWRARRARAAPTAFQPGVRPAVPGRRDRPHDVRADGQERHTRACT